MDETKEAVQEIAKMGGAITAMQTLPEGLFIVPDGYSLQGGHRESEDSQERPAHRRGQVNMNNAASLVRFVRTHGVPDRTAIFADHTKGVVRAIIDYHATSYEPGHCLFSARLLAVYSEAFSKWDAVCGGGQRQREFAEFIEDNMLDIVDPDGATVLEVARHLSAKRNVAFRSKVDLHSGDNVFTYEEQTSTGAQKGSLAVPEFVTIRVPVYEGEDPEEIRIRFGFRIGDNGTLVFVPRIIGIQALVAEAFGRLWDRMQTNLEAFPMQYEGTP